MKYSLSILVIVATAFAISGCSAVRMADKGLDVFSNVSAAYKSYYAFKMVGDLSSLEPIYSGADVALVTLNLAPANEQKAPEIRRAANAAVASYLADAFAAANMDVAVCTQPSACPPGRRVALVFTEEGYNDDIANKLIMGGDLRGQLMYIDGSSSAVLYETRVESSDDYLALVSYINRISGGMIMRSAQAQGAAEEELQALGEQLNDTDAVAEPYQDVLATG